MLIATFDDLPISLNAVLLDLVASGEWDEIRSSIRVGLACEAAEPSEGVDELARAAEVRFRRRRRLLSAEDLRGWLAERDIGAGEWRSHIRRSVMVELCADPDAILTENPIDDDAVGAQVRSTLLLDGIGEATVDRLLEGAAAADILGGPGESNDAASAPEGTGDAALELAQTALTDPCLALTTRSVSELSDDAALVLRLEAARLSMAEQTDDREIREVIVERRVDWTHLEYERLHLPIESAAREALLCIRDDGLDLAEVGARAGVQSIQSVGTAAEAGAVLSPHLLAGTIGSALGPIAVDDGWSVVVLVSRIVPDADDPTVWNKARDEVVADRLARRLAGRVKHHAVV